MSAICGIMRMDGRPVNRLNADEMFDKLNMYDFDSRDRVLKDNIFFGCGMQFITPESVYEKLPYHDVLSDLIITADAIIDNRSELFELLGISVVSDKIITDSDLILLAYKKWRQDCPKYLVGDFAFAIWDNNNKCLFCARDHVGKRTFYYTSFDNTFAFCTLLKPFFKGVIKEAELNEKWITDFLSLEGPVHEIEASETVYKDIYQLPPASTLIITQNSCTISKYWDPLKAPKIKMKSDEEYIRAFLKVFTNAVNCRLRTSGDVGLFLSGGLDSGSIASIAARTLAKENKVLKAYSSIPMRDFKNNLPKWNVPDETDYINSITEEVGNTDVTFFRGDGKNALSDMDYFLNILEQPYKLVESIYWSNGITELAAQRGCKVLLNGQFGNFTISYGDFLTNVITLYKKGKIHKVFKEIRAFSDLYGIPKSKINKRVLRAVLPYNLRRFISRKVNRFNDRFEDLPVNMHLVKKWSINKRFKEKGLYEQPVRFYDFRQMQKWMFRPDIFTGIGAIETKISLAHNIIIRDPTRDKRVIEFCLGLPPEMFVRNGEERYLIREAMKGLLPDKIRLNRQTRGMQSADWVQRLQPSWKNISRQLEVMFNKSEVGFYIDEKKIRNELERIGESPEESQSSSLRMLLVSMIFTQFIKKNKVV